MERGAFFGATLTPKQITLSLRRPHQSTPLQKWSFENEPIIKIGRASDNHVILHSSVVSRYHAELRNRMTHWEVISLGNNGTYFNDQSIIQVPIVDGMVISLALAGPVLQINLGSTAQRPIQKGIPIQRTVTQQEKDQQLDTFVQDSKPSSALSTVKMLSYD